MPSVSPDHLPPLDPADSSHFDALAGALGRYRSVVVAFSGGADSALLGFAATAVLGREAVLCATASSPSLAPEDLAETRAIAHEWGLRHAVVETDEVERPEYQVNDLNRCFFCKSALMDVLGPLAGSLDATVALGVNLDDLGEHRPGQQAARDAGAVFPLLEAGLSKQDVRSLSRALGLRTWDKPANACLASRIPQGTPVTVRLLDQVARAESVLRRLGFAQVRVRHHGEIARLELDPSEFERAIAARATIVEALRATGYRYVALDLDGFSSGNLVRGAIERANES